MTADDRMMITRQFCTQQHVHISVIRQAGCKGPQGREFFTARIPSATEMDARERRTRARLITR